MKYNKKASGKISRRSFAQTVAASIIAAPLTSAEPQVRTAHIPPPIEIFSGSVILETDDLVKRHSDDAPHGAPYPRKHVFEKDKRITAVRVVVYNCNNEMIEMIDADYPRVNPPGREGSIEIWVRDITAANGHMVFRTPRAGGLLQVEIDNTTHSFDNELNDGGTASHPRKRRKYTDPDAKILKVRLSKPDGSSTEVSTGDGKKIMLIQIRTVKVPPPRSHSPQKKPI